MRILLAEDDINVALIMRLCLEKIGGHTVEVADDGEKAFNAASHGGYDLILLDGMMPKKNGLQVAQELRDAGNQIPIIFLSAKSSEQEFLALSAGYIAKPFEPTTICARIEEILKNQNRAATG
jgi:DNA-binding response OmpR family regulator